MTRIINVLDLPMGPDEDGNYHLVDMDILLHLVYDKGVPVKEAMKQSVRAYPCLFTINKDKKEGGGE